MFRENLTSEEELALQTEVEILTQVFFSFRNKIDHPNVVKLYEIYEDDDKFYMVLELMTGGEVNYYIISNSYSLGYARSSISVKLKQSKC